MELNAAVSSMLNDCKTSRKVSKSVEYQFTVYLSNSNMFKIVVHTKELIRISVEFKLIEDFMKNTIC